MAKRVSEKQGVSIDEVQQIGRYMQKKIRNMDSMTAHARLIMEIPQVAKAYGARYDLGEYTLTECIQVVTQQFADLAIEEIAIAYRRWASGKTQVKGGEMYGGEFNAAQMGKVLTAYNDQRKSIAAAVTVELIIAKQREAEAAKLEEKRQAFELNFERYLENLRQTAKSWEDVPAFWYDSLKTRGKMKLEMDYAMEVWHRALKAAKKEGIENRLKMESDIIGESRAKVIARKMSVWDWLQKTAKP